MTYCQPINEKICTCVKSIINYQLIFFESGAYFSPLPS